MQPKALTEPLPLRKEHDRMRLPGPLPARVVLWCLLFLVFPLSVTSACYSFQVEVIGARTVPTVVAHPGLERHSDPHGWTDRVLTRLEQFEIREIDPWLQGDYRQAWISVFGFSRGKFPTFEAAFTAASYTLYGCHPEQLWPRIVARRHALLGSSYAEFFPEGRAPKKPCASVGRQREETAA